MTGSGKSLLFCAVSAAAACCAAADFSDENGFSIIAGCEYQLISQEYYNAVIDTISLDIIETWRFDRQEIDDFIFRTNVGYKWRRSANRLGFLANLEVSGDRVLGRGEGSWQTGNYDRKLEIFSKVESRSPYNGNVDRVDEYNFFQTQVKAATKLASAVRVNGRAGCETVVFPGELFSQPGDTGSIGSEGIFPNYDYSILSARVGGDFLLSEFSNELSWSLDVNHRIVPDSALANYDRLRVELEYAYIGLWGFFNLLGEVELKDYAQPDGYDDFVNFGFNGRANRGFGDRLELGATVWYDLYRFDRVDVVNRNHSIVRGELKGSYEVSGVSMGPMARGEFRREEEIEAGSVVYFSESYDQWELGTHVEFFGVGSVFFNAEATYGARNYRGSSTILTSYDLVSASLIGNVSICRNFSVSAIFDGNFEYHRVKEDNSNLYLLSISVNARI